MDPQFSKPSFTVPALGTPAYRENHERTFGEPVSPFCAECGQRRAWCECKRHSKCAEESKKPGPGNERFILELVDCVKRLDTGKSKG